MKTKLPTSKQVIKLLGIVMMMMTNLISHTMAQSACSGPVFPAPADILANVPEAAGYNLVYKLPIPSDNQAWTDQSQIPYSVNNSVALASTGYTRIGYYMKLESIYLGTQWVWVSFDRFTSDISKIGIPTGSTLWQQPVANMNVLNYSGRNQNGITGNVEIWPNCYLATNSAAVPGASDDLYDFGDQPTIDPTCTYGSFQVHDINGQFTLLSYNGWGSTTGTSDDLGVDNNIYGGQPDWTFVGNAYLYDVKELYVFVNTVAVASCNNTTIYLDATGHASITAAMVTSLSAGNCGIQSVSLSKSSFDCSNLGNNTVIVTATNVNNNNTTCSSVVTVLDTIRPVITPTGTITNLGYNPTPAAINAGLGSATVTDNCGPLTATFTDGIVTSEGCIQKQTRTWNVMDASGNAAIPVSRTVAWKTDTQAPVIIATGTTLTLGISPSAAAIEAALGTATASDNCGTPTLSVVTGPVVVNGCASSQTRTWNALDASGNHAIPVSRTVSWSTDNVAPVIVATGTTLTLGINPSAAAIEAALGTATVSDNCGTPTLSVITGAVITSGCASSQTRTWNSIDASGNPAIPVSRTVSWSSDNIAPVIVATGTTLTLGISPSAAAIEAALGTATASDNCSTAILSVVTSPVVVNGCTSSQTRTWNAIDASGNAAIPVTRTVSWSADNVPPVITATGTTLTLGISPSAAAIEAALGTAIASDNCSTATLSAVTGPVVVNGCSSSQTRTWNALDASGNAAIAVSRTVSWSADNVPPVITATGTTLTLGFYPSNSAIEAALGTATATDNCGIPTLTVSTSAVSVNGCTESKTRTWVATDAAGNTSTVSRKVTWTADHMAPVITATGTTLTLGCNPSSSAINAALGSATVTENCTFALMLDFTSPVTANGCSRTQTRTWYAVDLTLNISAPVSRTVTWTADLIPPVITATGTTLNLGCNPSAAAIEAALGTATATDNCGTPSLSASTGAVTIINSSITQKRTWTSQDACGNVSTVSRTITWPKSCFSGNNTNQTGRMTGSTEITFESLSAAVQQNPVSDFFNLLIKGRNNSPVLVKISDRFGRVMMTNDRVSANSTLRVGAEWPAGAYIAEIVQGNERVIVKMVKL